MDEKPVPRKRAKHTRSKLGCRVCRIRRVRCDRTRPACVKCTSTGRTCEGYSETGKPSSAHAILPHAGPYLLLGNHQEERSLFYFQTQTAKQFSAPFGNDFWTRLVLQVAVREPCVKHALMALGSLHEAFEEERTMTTTSSVLVKPSLKSRDHAYSYYAKSLIGLNAHIYSCSWEGLDVALLCCSLCVVFEWLRGRFKDAMVHLRNGLLVLRQWTETQRVGNSIGISYSSPTGHLLRGQIAPMFLRLAIQARTMTDDVPLVPWPSAVIAPGFQKIQDRNIYTAREELDVILSEVYLHPDSITQPHLNLSKSAQIVFSARLTQWHSEYHMHLYPLGSEPCLDSATPAKITLTLWHSILTIMLAASHSTNEQIFDTFFCRFQHMVSLADLIITGSSISTISASPPSSRFCVDMDLIVMLYYVASKCRHPMLRRRALALMRIDAGREGSWDASAHARLVEECVLIEEEGIDELVDEKSIPSDARVYKTCEHIDLDSRSMEVKFWTQGKGELGPARVITW